MKSLIRFFCFFLLFISPPLFAKKTVRLCTVDWPPFTIVDKSSNQIEGIHVDIVNEVFKRIDLNVEIESIPWKRCLKMVEDGQRDGVFAVSYNKDRARYLLYPKEPLDIVEYVVATTVHPEKAGWSEKKQFSSVLQPLGSPQGYSVTADLKKEIDLKVDDGAVNDRVNFQKILGGRVNSIVMLRQALDQMIKSEDAASKIYILEPPYVEGKKYYIGIRKSYKDEEIGAEFLVGAIDKTIEHLTSTKNLKSIRDRYYSK